MKMLLFSGSTLKQVTIILIVIALVLLGYGLMITPTALRTSSGAAFGPIAAFIALLAYVLASRVGPLARHTTDPGVLKPAVFFGLLIGTIFLVQIMSEYLFPITGQIDEIWGYVAFGGLPLWYLLTSLIATSRTHSLRAGIRAAMWSAIISSLIWINGLFLLYYLFLHTPQETLVLLADNTMADFKQSGMHDLSAFVMQDYAGACFFHLLLSPLVAALVGIPGGVLGKGLLWVHDVWKTRNAASVVREHISDRLMLP